MKVSELTVPFANAEKILRQLKSKYPTLDAQLVVCTQHGLTEPVADCFHLFEHIPSAFVDSDARKEALILTDTIKDLRRRNRELKNPFVCSLVKHCYNRLSLLLNSLEIMDSLQIQLRFGELDFDLIGLLQKDPLIDQFLTPQSRSSIRVTLGTLKTLR